MQSEDQPQPPPSGKTTDAIYAWVRRPRTRRRRALLLASALVILGTAVAFFGYIYLALTVPKLNKLTDYQPARVTEVYSANLEKFAEFSEERRFLMPYENIPKMLVNAFVSSEDAHFFSHEGIDYRGIMRAFFKNVLAGRVVQGGSTITQQVAKSLLLSSERSLRRKIKEAFLALRIEKNLTKDEILYLYLNQIYLGHAAYGVQAAALNYFRKDVQNLSLAQCAFIAGLPQAPSRYSPFRAPKAAKERQIYVLTRMHEEGYITDSELEKARTEPLVIYERKDLNLEVAPDFAEYVRRYIQEKYGNEKLYRGGLKIFTTVDLQKQTYANTAVRRGLREVDKRQGYRGVLGHVDLKNPTALEEFRKTSEDEVGQEDFITLTDDPDNPVAPRTFALLPNKNYRALVVGFDANGNHMDVQVGDQKGRIHIQDLKWVREPNVAVRFEEGTYYLKDPRKKFKLGDIVLVALKSLSPEEIRSKKFEKDITYFLLEQDPAVQGALLSLDPETGFVVAMVGGYDFKTSEFNRAVQGVRQPGSAFKPLIYAAALDKGFSESTIIVDSPIVYQNESEKEEESKWRPKNYGGKFQGDTTFRKALVKSMNVITIKILQEIGVNFVSAYAQNLGIVSPINRDLSLALGSSDVSLLELTKVYGVFARGGRRVQSLMMTKIESHDGAVLERFTDEMPDLTLSETIGWLQKTLYASRIEWDRFQILKAKLEQEKAQAALKENATPPGEQTPTPETGDETEINGSPTPSPTPDLTSKNPFNLNLSKEEKEIVFEKPPPGYAITPQTAYLITHLMTHVVQYGTAQYAKRLGRPVAGKTGTTNDEFDAWFLGYSPDLVTGVWVGFDQKKQLGKGETGGKAAVPIWTYFMEPALEPYPNRGFSPPQNVVFSTVSKETGLLASTHTPPEDRIQGAYVEGTEPTLQDKPRSSFQEDYDESATGSPGGETAEVEEDTDE